MDKQNAFPIQEYVDVALRRKWFIIIPFILITAITTFAYWRMPKTYRSDTMILLIPQRIPEDYVSPTVTTPVEARLRSVSEEILSRTRLETIIAELNLYPEFKKPEFMDQAIDKMRKAIEIEVKGESSFRIYYQNENPETAKVVTSKLASLFIEENLKTREQQARITSDFLAKELASVKRELEGQEKKITEFKYRNMGKLPEQNEANLAMLSQLTQQRQAIRDSIVRLEDRKLLVQQIPETGEPADVGVNTPIQVQLQTAKNRLVALKSTYTDEHVEVKKVKAHIKNLEDQLLSAAGVQDQETGQTKEPLMGLDLTEDVKFFKKEEARITRQIALYQKRLEEAPRVELQLADLTRDYNNTKTFYEDLLSKNMKAEQAENLERRQQGEQFRVLDPASLPRVPYKPDPYKVFPFGIILGIGTGFGLAFLTEMLDKSLRNVKEAEEYLDVPVLATIPLIKKKAA